MSFLCVATWSFILTLLKPASSLTSDSCSSGSEWGEFSSFIPFANYKDNKDLARDMTLNVTISTVHAKAHETPYNRALPMDTGSTGVAIGAKSLGLTLQDLSKYPPGVEYLSSSRVFWEGYWVDAKDVNVDFAGTGLTAQVPIFAVTVESVCTRFINGGCSPRHKVNVTDWPEDVHYLGSYIPF